MKNIHMAGEAGDPWGVFWFVYSETHAILTTRIIDECSSRLGKLGIFGAQDQDLRKRGVCRNETDPRCTGPEKFGPGTPAIGTIAASTWARGVAWVDPPLDWIGSVDPATHPERKT